MASSTRLRILEAMRARLRRVTVGATDDTYVFLGETPDLGPDDPDIAIAIMPGDDAIRRQGDKFLITLPIEIQALVKVELDHAHLKGEELLADIKTAIELDDDRSLGGLVTRDSMQRLTTRVLPRDEGMTSVGLGVTYTVDYQETWGAP